MDTAPQRLLFNTSSPAQPPLAAGDPADPPLAIPPEDPPVELVLDPEGIPESVRADGGAGRTPKQTRRIGAMQLDPLATDPFGTSPGWAYRCYQVQRPASAPAGGDWPFQEHLYLLNLLVALEWAPSDLEIERLAWAFRSASDFLFDATDGWIALGQVAIGGPELMAAADIQIMASNRMLPRSWVGGMHPIAAYQNDEKFMAVRIGRGLWSDSHRAAIPWEEPEGYRIIVHELGHYALRLTDEYLETRPVATSAAGASGAPRAFARASDTTVVLLKPPTTSDSIMATTEGISELVTNQWPKLNALYPRISPTRADQEERPGPNRLPLPLPAIRRLASSPAGTAPDPQVFPQWNDELHAALARQGLPDDIPLDRCWLYILKGLSDQQPNPSSLIAQGTLEARTARWAYPLLGAAAGDTIVLIGEQRNRRPVVLAAALAGDQPLVWRDATPPAFPTIDVLPEPVAPNQPRASIRVRLSFADGQPAEPPEQICVYPFGQMPDQTCAAPAGPYTAGWTSEPIDLPTLDGHVLTRWAGGQLTISTFSQGGDGPNSSSPWPANPINAGSADGNALLFMYKENADDRAPNDLKVVTSIARGMPPSPDGWRDRGYSFGITSNQALLPAFNPSLFLYYDVFGEDEQAAEPGDLRICRWADGAWQPLPTYLPNGFRFAIAPLDTDSGGALLDPAAPGPRAEHYKVCWVPRAT